MQFAIPRAIVTVPALVAILLLALVTPARADGEVDDCSDDSALASVLLGGGTVTFDCGVATISLSTTKTISAATTIDGGGKITLSGDHARRLFAVNPGASLDLRNIVLTSGYGSDGNGGAIVSAGFLGLDNVTIRDTTDSGFDGGAIATTGGADITDSSFINNKAGRGGALFASGLAAQVSINGSSFTQNSVSSNVAGSNRGGVLYAAAGATIDVFDSIIDDNAAGTGGAIYNDQSTTNLTRVALTNNKAQSGAGGIYSKGTLSIDDSTLAGNTTRNGDGGGIYNLGIATLTDVTLFQNSSSYGGGIANDHGTLTVTRGTVSRNSANVAGGGGIANESGTITLSDLTVSGNGASGDAGGVENGRGTATLTNVTISGNSASSGGGMWNLFGGVATLTNVTIFGNRAFDSAGGIGNSNDPDTHLYLRNVLVTDSMISVNCDFQKAPDSLRANLSSDGSCHFGSGRNSVSIALGPLETNGGTSQTHRPLPGSAAIDAGTSAGCPAADERGVTRYRGQSCDVGAVEFVPCAAAPTKPLLLSPLSGKVTTARALLDWAGPDCATEFSVIVHQDSKTGPIVLSKTTRIGSQQTTGILPTGHSYFWQVSACNGAACTPSGWGKFKRK